MKFVEMRKAHLVSPDEAWHMYATNILCRREVVFLHGDWLQSMWESLILRRI